MHRPRAERCRRLALVDVRPLVEPPADAVALRDGTELELRWGPAHGCYGGRPGRALLLVCPSCRRSCRVLWSPPAAPWACGLCHRISYRSHRRPGARKGRPKPMRWHREAIHREQYRCVDLLGLAQYPPNRLIWSLRVLTHAPGIMALCKQVGSAADLSPPEGLRERAEEVIHRTGWAVRRGPCDPRTTRGG